MAKEKKPVNHLSPVQYWEWRCTISDMHLAKKEQEKAVLELKLLQKEAELHAVRQSLFQNSRMETANQNVKSSVTEYERFKKQLEEAIGQSLSGKLIDDMTFEIKDLSNENN